MIRHFLLFTLILMLSVGIYLYFFLGFREPVEIVLQNRPALQTVGKDHLGAYHEIMPTLEAVEQYLKSKNIPCVNSFGHYLDNPDLVEVARLRAVAGCIVTAAPSESLPPDLHMGEIAARPYLVAKFAGSPSIGPFTVYPTVREYAKSHQLKLRDDVVEIYSIVGSAVQTEYLFSIDP